MRNYTEYIIDYSEGNLTDDMRLQFEIELSKNEELRNEYKLFKQVNAFMKGKLELEEIKLEPNIKDIDALANLMISEYQLNPNKYKNIREFVESALKNYIENKKLKVEIDEIQREIKENNINELVNELVNRWDDKKDEPSVNNIRSFVSSSLENSKTPELKIPHKKEVKWYNKTLYKVSGLAAAATLALVLIIKTLSPTQTPDSIFSSYYQPFGAITTITRNEGNDPSNQFNSAIEEYKRSDFKKASASFEMLIQNDPNSVSTKFFAGLSQIELANYDKAVSLLSDVEKLNGDFSKEAKWYLGLIYLKTNNLEKAISYFEGLTESPGYYQKQSSEILKKIR